MNDTSRTITWVSSARTPDGALCIARTTSDGVDSEVKWLTDSDHNDYKPVISPDGKQIAFFRTYREDPDFYNWESSICLMNADGSDFRELTGRTFMNTEPYWTRDGSRCVVFSRMVHPDKGAAGTYVYRTPAGATPGDEECLSATNREWVNSALRDGRLFVKRERAYFFMTPAPDGKSQYEEISYPDSWHYLHKLTISNDETMIAYMKHTDTSIDEYRGAEIVYARLDTAANVISDEVAFVPQDPSTFAWYVTISPDNQYLLYVEDGRVMEYDVERATTRQVSTRDDIQYRYPVYEGSVK